MHFLLIQIIVEINKQCQDVEPVHILIIFKYNASNALIFVIVVYNPFIVIYAQINII